MKLTIYQKPTCTTCRQVCKVLEESGVKFAAVNYFLEPLTKSKLKELLAKMGLKARDIVRTKEEVYKKLKLADKELSESEWLGVLVEYPELIQRPIVEKGAKAILARPTERIKEIL